MFSSFSLLILISCEYIKQFKVKGAMGAGNVRKNTMLPPRISAKVHAVREKKNKQRITGAQGCSMFAATG